MCSLEEAIYNLQVNNRNHPSFNIMIQTIVKNLDIAIKKEDLYKIKPENFEIILGNIKKLSSGRSKTIIRGLLKRLESVNSEKIKRFNEQIVPQQNKTYETQPQTYYSQNKSAGSDEKTKQIEELFAKLRTIETREESFKLRLESLESKERNSVIRMGVIESKERNTKAKIESLESKDKTIETRIEKLESNDKNKETRMKAIESKGKIMESKLETKLADNINNPEEIQFKNIRDVCDIIVKYKSSSYSDQIYKLAVGFKSNESYFGEILESAINNNDCESVEKLIPFIKLNGGFKNFENPAAFALNSNKMNIFNLLIRKGTNPNSANLIWKCFEKRQKESIKVLIENGGNINTRIRFNYYYNNEKSIIELACENQYYDVFQLLVQKGAIIDESIFFTNDYNQQIEKIIFENVKDINQFKINNLDALFDKAHSYNRGNLINYFANNFNFDSSNINLYNLLSRGYKNETMKLIEKGANVNIIYRTGYNEETLLDLADTKGYTDVFNLLIEKGASIPNTYLIEHAFIRDNTDLIKKCINLCNDSNINNPCNKSKQTILEKALCGRHSDIVELALMKNADPNLPLLNKTLPLFRAIELNNITYVQLLVKYGANINAKNINNYTLLEYARYIGYNLDIICFLIEKGTKVSDSFISIYRYNTQIMNAIKKASTQ